MSAKNAQGGSGKKPTSAAVNLIGRYTLRIEAMDVILTDNSWWWCRYDGSSCLPSFRYH